MDKNHRCNTKINKLEVCKLFRENKYKLLKRDFELSTIEFNKNIKYIMQNNEYYNNFLSSILTIDCAESKIMNNFIDYILSYVDVKNFNQLFINFKEDEYENYLLLHDAINNVIEYLSSCKKAELEMNKLSFKIYVDDIKIKILKRLNTNKR